MNAAARSEATVDTLVKNMVLTWLFWVWLDCCTFHALGWHHMSSIDTLFFSSVVFFMSVGVHGCCRCPLSAILSCCEILEWLHVIRKPHQSLHLCNNNETPGNKQCANTHPYPIMHRTADYSSWFSSQMNYSRNCEKVHWDHLSKSCIILAQPSAIATFTPETNRTKE